MCAAVQVAPSVAAMVLLTSLPLLAALMATIALFGVFVLRTLSSPVRGNGHVYGMSITSCSAVSAGEWRQRQLDQAERPDVKDEIPDNGWITDDVQVRPARQSPSGEPGPITTRTRARSQSLTLSPLTQRTNDCAQHTRSGRIGPWRADCDHYNCTPDRIAPCRYRRATACRTRFLPHTQHTQTWGAGALLARQPRRCL